MFSKFWQWFWQPSAKYTLGGIFIVGAIGGIIFWGGFNTYVEYTNTEAFCISCHEMEDYVYKEYQKTIHYNNRSGVRAVCSDCHVPREWFAKMARKIRASNELYHKVLGTIDTPEKFEAKRETLAKHVWQTMKENDSKECRNCHDYQYMDFHAQSITSRREMKKGIAEGKTCIDCHKGIAHKLPDGYEADSVVHDD